MVEEPTTADAATESGQTQTAPETPLAPPPYAGRVAALQPNEQGSLRVPA